MEQADFNTKFILQGSGKYLNLFNYSMLTNSSGNMAGIFDAIPVITVILFALGIVGVMVYERSKTKEEANKTKESTA